MIEILCCYNFFSNFKIIPQQQQWFLNFFLGVQDRSGLVCEPSNTKNGLLVDNSI